MARHTAARSNDGAALARRPGGTRSGDSAGTAAPSAEESAATSSGAASGGGEEGAGGGGECTAAGLAELVGGRVEGDPAYRVHSVAPLSLAGPRDVTFVDSERNYAALATSGAGCFLVPLSCPALPQGSTRALIRVEKPRLAICLVLNKLHPPRATKPGIHPTAVVGAHVTLGEGVSIGPYAIIGDGARIGDRTAVGSGVSIGAEVQVGADCFFHPNTTLYAGTVVGHRVIVHAGAVIGSDGFGYVRNGEEYVKFPQVGRAVLEDDVEVGANTTIDRGAIGDTIVRRGTKIDNLVQIAHNVTLGESCAISAQVGISGSTRVGRDVVMAGQVGVGDRVQVGDRVVIGAQSGVATGKTIPPGQTVLGSPVRPIDEQKEIYALVGILPRLRKEIQDLKHQVRDLLSSNGHHGAPGASSNGKDPA